MSNEAKRATHTVYTWKGGVTMSQVYWTKVGEGTINPDGSITFTIEAENIDGKTFKMLPSEWTK